MPHLFSPLKIVRIRLPNRIVLAPLASGYAVASGFISDALIEHYVRRAEGGAGLLIVEAALVEPPPSEDQQAHIGLYHDAFIPQLACLAREVHTRGASIFLTLESSTTVDACDAIQIEELREVFIRAGWRALAAGCDGVLLSAADGGALHTLISPLHNRRLDHYGSSLDGRLRLSLEIIEGLRAWLGKRLVIAFRINADELVVGGMTLQDTRVIAKRLVAAGVHLLDITLIESDGAHVARFPGWRVPLAAGIKRVLPEVPVITSGSLGDPELADGVVRDGSADLVMLGNTLLLEPNWPQQAFHALHPEGM